ncbi:MAG: hypothetical protein ACOC1F_05535 [Myxococcota bacterium]
MHTGSAHGTGVGHSFRGGSYTVETKVDAYSNLCTAPCEVTLPTGTHRLALSRDKGTPVEPDDPIRLEGDSVVEGKYISNSGIRIAGGVVAIGSPAVGVGLILTSTEEEEVCDHRGCRTESTLNDNKLLGGVAVTLVGGGIGYLLLQMPDGAEISVTPMSSTGLGGTQAADRTETTDALVPRGAALYGRF